MHKLLIKARCVPKVSFCHKKERPYCANDKFIVTLNKSPSKYRLNFPPCNSVKLVAIESPSPLPSVFLEVSPLTNLCINSSADMFSLSFEVFFN